MCFYLVEVAWPLWHCRFCLYVQNQAGWGCACVKGLGVIPLGGSLMAHMALPHAACPRARSPQLWCRMARGTVQWTWLEAKNRHFYGAVFNLHHFPAPDHCLTASPFITSPVPWRLWRPSGRQAGLPRACAAAGRKGSCSPHMETQTLGIVCHRESSEEILLHFWMQFPSCVYILTLYDQQPYF